MEGFPAAKALPPGSLVTLNAADGRALGVATFTPHALVAARILDRDAARGMRLNIASGTAVRFEPGQQRTVELVDYAGDRIVVGFRGLVQGAL